MERTGSVKRKIVSQDLQEERDKCNFDKKELREILEGGKENVELLDSW
jgi:hypothetical protein